MSKTVVCLVCGGQSAEHEVSLQSARNVLAAMNRDRFDVVLVGIMKNGVWNYYEDQACFLDHADDPKLVRLSETSGAAAFPTLTPEGAALVELESGKKHHFDMFFPVLHGTNGEDGAFQGLARMLNVPCAGCEQAASANCMDKDLTKRLLEGAQIRVARWCVLHKGVTVLDTEKVIAELGLPLFVKPARTGSSVGVSKVRNAEELKAAVTDAFRFDSKLLIEEAIVGREIECAVLGNEHPRCAVPGEVVPTVDFYSYDAKYIDDDGAVLKAPAELTQAQIEQVQALACRAFSRLECAGMSRVDFFLTPEGEWILNEINTIPGFTKISMYPRLWQLSGLTYAQLVEQLIDLALVKPPVQF